jgi:trimethylamine--corrinoid protein Co-methyltransferase
MIPAIRPTMRVLGVPLLQRIVDESFDVLEKVGVFVENREALDIFVGGGGRYDAGRVFLPRTAVEKALATAPHTITLYDVSGATERIVGGDNVHFDPGSAALRVFDHALQSERDATTRDLVNFARLVDTQDNIHLQSTAIVSSDVPQAIADCYRLYVGLLFCSKPIVTGTFVVEGFSPMHAMLSAVRGGAAELRKKPLAVFDACPSPPLKWSTLTAQSVIDCARAGIPSEFISMPLTGATSPVTLTGALVQHTAENLSGVVLAQLTAPGAPVIHGGSPAAFDLRTGNPPMGAMETMLIDMAYAQIGKSLNLPTHTYMGLSDSKCVDGQAGLESGIGAVLAASAGINIVSGPGMMDFESCQSLEKLVIDNEICGMAYRLLEGIAQRDEPMALDLFATTPDGGFLTHEHTLRWMRAEHKFPRIIDRGNAQQWQAAGKPTLADRAAREVERLLAGEGAPLLEAPLRRELHDIMLSHARRHGMGTLPL